MINELFKITEIKMFLRLTGSVNFLGNGVFTQASYTTIKLQKLTGKIKVGDVITGIKVLRYIISHSILEFSSKKYYHPTFHVTSDSPTLERENLLWADMINFQTV